MYNSHDYIENKNVLNITVPTGWVWSDLGSITTIITDYQANGSFASLKKNVKYYDNKNYAILVRLKDLRKNLEEIDDLIYTDKFGYDFLKKSSLHGGEFLVANVGSGVGTTVIMPNIDKPATLAPNMFIVVPSVYINKKYYYYYSQSNLYFDEIRRVSGGSGQPKINKKDYRSIKIPIPPLAEQERIINKLEKLLIKLEDGRKILNTLKSLVEDYYQSILKSAFDGTLTEDWRVKNRTQNSSLKVKKSHYGSAADISQEVTSLQTIIPKEWDLIELDHVVSINPRLDKGNYDDKMEVSFIPMKAIEEESGHIDLSCTKELGEVKKGYTPFINGDILFAKITPCMENGKIAIANNLKNGIGFGSTEFYVIRPNNNIILEKFLFYYLVQRRFRQVAKTVMTGSGGHLRVPLSFLKQVKIPIPSIDEQTLIVEKVEELVSLTFKIAKIIECNLTKTDMLKTNILKKTFEGNLVSQISEDEPAEELIARIYEEKKELELDRKRKTPELIYDEFGEESIMDEKFNTNKELYEILLSSEKDITPKQLLDLSGITDIEEFYSQLKELVETGKVNEVRPDEKNIILEAKP